MRLCYIAHLSGAKITKSSAYIRNLRLCSNNLELIGIPISSLLRILVKALIKILDNVGDKGQPYFTPLL